MPCATFLEASTQITKVLSSNSLGTLHVSPRSSKAIFVHAPSGFHPGHDLRYLHHSSRPAPPGRLVHFPPTKAKMAKLLPGAVSNIVVITVFIILDALAVILRLIAKRRTKHRFGYDDSWIIFALFLFFIWAGLVIHCKLTVRLE